MTVLAAGNNEGRYNRVHRQTDDGLVISVAAGGSLVPLVFRYADYLGDLQSSLLAAAFYPHKKLMRGDCGWRVKDDSVDMLFSWNALEKVSDGFSSGPSGEYVENYHEVPNCAKDVRIAGLQGHRKTYYRKDREYWTPDNTLQATAPEDIFGWSQFNPQACPPREPNKCGLVNLKEKC